MERTLMNRAKTAVLVLAVMLGAAVVAIMPTSQSRDAEADPTGVIGLNGGICLTLGIAFGGLDSVSAANACGTLELQNSLQEYVVCLRSSDQPRALNPTVPDDQILIDAGYPNPIPRDGVQTCGEGVETGDDGLLHPTPDDFAALDLDANQFHVGQTFFVIAFIDDEASVRFRADEGLFDTEEGVDGDITCTSALWDEDCDDDPSTPGDGVVAARLTVDEDVEPGTYEGVVVHEGIGWPFTYTVVGPPEDITLEALFGKPNISVGGDAPTAGAQPNPDDPGLADGIWDTIPGPPAEDNDCNFAATVDGVLGANSHPNKMVVVAKALDSDGNEVVGALIEWSWVWGGDEDTVPFSEESDIANAALPQTPTLDTGALGIGFPQFVCSGDEEGTIELAAHFSPQISPASNLLEEESIEITVIGPPANVALTVDPPVLACDGTASATVTAMVTTANGDPVSNGTDISWSVQTLGTVSPLSGDLTAGAGTANVTPFAGVNTGVPVIATVDGVQGSVLVQCGPGSAPPTPGEPVPGGGAGPGGVPPTGTVRPPDTGSAGDLDGRASLNVWAAVALFAGAMALIGARVALRRV